MKRVLVLLMALSMLLMITACKRGEPNNSETDGGKKEQILKVAALESAYGRDIWDKIVKAFEAENKNVTVKLTVDKKLEDVISPGMKSGSYPDFVHLAAGREAALTDTLIKENGLLDITDVLSMTVPGENVTVKEKIVPGFVDTSLTNPYGDGKTYLAPMFYSPCGLFYNAGLFEEKGWELPETWDDMWKLGDKAKAEGIALFTYPTAGYFDTFFYGLLYEAGGPGFFEKAASYSKNVWETSEANVIFDLVSKLASYTEATTPANATDENYLKNQQLVLDNKAIFMPNGSWVIGEMKDAPRAGNFKWGFMALPALKTGGDRYSYTWFEQCWIPQKAENKDLAKKFMAFLYSDKAVKIFAEGGAVQPVTGVSNILDGDNKLYYSIYDKGAKAALGAFAATNPVEGVEIRSVWFEPINSLITGNKTKAEWVDGIKKASDQLRAALK